MGRELHARPAYVQLTQQLDSLCAGLDRQAGAVHRVSLYCNAATLSRTPGLAQQLLQLCNWSSHNPGRRRPARRRSLPDAEAAPPFACELCRVRFLCRDELLLHFVEVHQTQMLEDVSRSLQGMRAWCSNAQQAHRYLQARQRLLHEGQALDDVTLRGGIHVTVVGDGDQAADKALTTDLDACIRRPRGHLHARPAACIVTDDCGYEKVLRRCTAAGWFALAVTARTKRYPGAERTLDWHQLTSAD